MDGFLKKNLDEIKKVIKKDWDMVFIVDGREGSGKSVLAQQCAKYVDETFDITRIAFNSDEFIEQIGKAEKYQAVVYDEAYGGLSSRAAISEVNRSLVSMLAEIRQKNLFVFIVLPCFFELDKYAAIWRSCGLLHVYTGENFERGRFTFYNYERKKDLYMVGKKFYSYNRPPPNFRGSFVEGYAVDDTEYRKKKLQSLETYKKKPETITRAAHRLQRNVGIKMLYEKGVTPKEIAKEMGLSHSGINALLREMGFEDARAKKIVTNLENRQKNEGKEGEGTLHI